MQVLQLRGGLVETRHAISAVISQASGAEPGSIGATFGPPTSSTWRSSAKPLQLWCSLEALGDPPDLDPAQLALGASSHSGQDGHVAAVQALLERWDLPLSALRCGAEPPAHAPTARALLAAGRPWSPLHNDCSGKHAFMLAACRARGWSTDTYLSPDHPLQRRIVQVAATWSGEPPALAVDGCGLPTLWLSLAGMARVWARLAAATADPGVDPRLHRIGAAMAAQPWWTSGDERIDLALHRRATEPWIGKIGARGVFNVALPARGLGLALKVHDGDEQALAVAVPALVDRVAPGALAPAPDWPWARIHNVVGRVVGTRVAVGLAGA